MGVRSFTTLCFNCRKGFKRSFGRAMHEMYGWCGKHFKCPECGKPMFSIQRVDVPKRTNKTAWKKLHKQLKVFLK